MMRFSCYFLLCIFLSSCAHFSASRKIESNCVWKNPKSNNCGNWNIEAPMPRPVIPADLEPFGGKFPAVELVNSPDTTMVEIYNLDSKCQKCGGRNRVTTGAVILCGQDPMVLTAKHTIGISELDFDLFPQDTLLIRHGFTYDPSNPPYEISDLTAKELEGKTVQMFFRLGESLYVMDLKIFVADWFRDSKRFLIPVPTDMGEYFGGVSGAPLFYKGKIIGVFSGFITARAEFSLASFSTPEILRSMLDEAAQSPSKIVIR